MEKTLVLKNKIEELPKIEGFLEQICEEVGLGMDVMFQLNLALEEAATNVVKYAYPVDEEHTLQMHARTSGNWLEFVLEDMGTPFDPTAVEDADVTLSAEERPIGGLGIFLVRQMMDEVMYERTNNKNILTMRKRLQTQ